MIPYLFIIQKSFFRSIYQRQQRRFQMRNHITLWINFKIRSVSQNLSKWLDLPLKRSGFYKKVYLHSTYSISTFLLQFFCTVFQSLFPAIISMGGENVWRNLPQICFSTKFPWPIYFIILSHKGLCWPLYVLKGHMQLGSPRKVSWLAECIKYLNQLQIFF